MKHDQLTIAGKAFNSRLLLGSARYPNSKAFKECLEFSGTEIVTVSLRRLSFENPLSTGILKDIDREKYFLLPNTAGCYTAHEAILTAQLAKEALETEWIKLEVIVDDDTLMPNSNELLLAAEELINQGFVVLPYCLDDPVLCQRLENIGCAAVMPLGSLIGSGMGILNPDNIQTIKAHASIPMIIDAGIGTASDISIAMELGADGVLVNTAIAQANFPQQMAEAFKHACIAGRLAHRAGRIPKVSSARASSPQKGKMEITSCSLG